MRALSWYNHMNTVRPVITKIATAGTLFGVGDVVCQKIERTLKGDPNRPFDFKRNVRFSLFGAFGCGPLFHLHFTKVLPWLVPNVDTKGLLLKVLIDQTAWASSFTCYIYFCLSKLEGKSNTEAVNNARNLLWPTLLTNWTVWPAVQLFNFKLVPIQYQMVVVQIVAIFWNAYISYMQNKPSPTG